MTQCSRCGQQLPASLPRATCPDCGHTPTSDEPMQWKPIARLSNLAEAGFYADFLEGEGFAARVHHRNDYSALDSTWESSFELQVGSDDVKAAFAALQQGIDLQEDEDDSGGAADGCDDVAHAVSRTYGGRRDRGAVAKSSRDVAAEQLEVPTRSSGPFTPSLAWVLVAGGLAYTLGRSGVGPGSQAEQDVLWQAIRHSSPFISEPAEGNPRRCLRYDQARREFVLEEDQNGDGVWDRQWRFAPHP